jgi:hypothetical protein
VIAEVGRLVTGMARRGYDLQLAPVREEGWRVTFYPARLGLGVRSPRLRLEDPASSPQSGGLWQEGNLQPHHRRAQQMFLGSYGDGARI